MEQTTNSIAELDTYTMKFWRVITSGLPIFMLLLVIGYFTLRVFPTGSFPIKVFMICLMLPFVCLCIYLVNRYLTCSKQMLQISEGSDVFYFGNDDAQNKYYKKDIEKITIYQPGGGGAGASNGSLHSFYVYEILFKDGTTIKFSNLLISETLFLENFPNDLVRYGVNKHSLWRL